MENILEKAKKDLRTYAKQNKKISFSIASAVSFLMTGAIVNADEITDTKKSIDNTVDTVNSNIKALRRNNEKLLRDRNLELVQLEEQGDQVVKSIWDSWQFGTSLDYVSKSNEGFDDKKNDFGDMNIYERGPWWEKNLNASSSSSKYNLLDRTNNPRSSLNNRNNTYSRTSLSTTKLVIPVDKGVLLDLSANVKPKTIGRTPTSLTPGVNPVTVTASVPPITAIGFSPISPYVNIARPIYPPELNDPSAGYGQGNGVGWMRGHFFIPSSTILGVVPAADNSVIDNASVSTLNVGGVTDIRIKDGGVIVAGDGLNYFGYNDVASGISGSISGHATYVHKFSTYASGIPVIWDTSPQAFLSVVSGSYNITGKWKFFNETSDPRAQASSATNSVRFVSMSHGYGAADKNIVFDMKGEVEIYGRTSSNETITGGPLSGKKHMTVGIEHQVFGALPMTSINSGKLELNSGVNMIGMTGMIEQYVRNSVPVPGQAPFSGSTSPRLRPWESEMKNTGTISIASGASKSIGVDFGEYIFSLNASGEGAYNNKGSQNIYVLPGNIELNGSTSYGLRVGNIFNGVDGDAIYYDETIINGKDQGRGGITVNGNSNVGVSISKIISMFRLSGGTQTSSVYDYQTHAGGNPLVGSDFSTITANINNTGRNSDDLIGNLYNLNIVVGGNNNVGFLRKSDYMDGSYTSATKSRAEKDFVLKISNDGTGHIESIDFKNTATGGTLIRTDKYGINLANGNTLTVTGMVDSVYAPSVPAPTPNNNVVMLANETQAAPTIKTAVRNFGTINLGTADNAGNALVGLMSYNAGIAENESTINVRSKNSVGIATMGAEAAVAPLLAVASSEGTNIGNINISGEKSVGIYNKGTFTMAGGTIDSKNKNTIGIYVENNTITAPVTKIQSGIVKASNGGVGIYANDFTTIQLGDANPVTTGLKLVSNSGGLMFYTKKAGTPGKYDLKEDVSLDINDGSVGFHGEDLSTFNPTTYFNTFFPVTTGKLNITTQNNNSTLFYIKGSSVPVSLSTLPLISTGTLPSNIVFNGTSGYRAYKAGNIELHIDRNLNLDDTTDIYNQSEFLSSKLYVDLNKIVTTAQSNKAMFAQRNANGSTLSSDILVENSGTLNSSGNSAAGIVTDFGVLTNKSTGIINMNGTSSAGMIGANSSLVKNEGLINIKDGSTGIVGINTLDPVTLTNPAPIYGKKGIDITHNGSIISSGTSTKNVGIYAKNDTSILVPGETSKVTLGLNSKIDVSSAPSSVGVYLENTDLTDNGGNIKIGDNGIGVYAKNNPGYILSLISGGKIESSGKEARGIYADVDVTSSKTIDLSGDNSIGIHTYGASLNNVINQGNIIIGNSSSSTNPSIGIYSNNSTNLENKSNITVGTQSLGIYSSNPTGTIKLSTGSTINVGSTGTGVYKKDGNLSLALGSTMALQPNNTIGVYTQNTTVTDSGSTMNIGDGSYGFVVTSGSVMTNTSLSSPQVIGNSSIYTYADNSTVTNSVAISSNGQDNIGIYGKNGSNVTNSAVIDMGQKIGNIGLYMEDTLTVGKNTSTIKVGDSGALNLLNPNDISYSIGISASKGAYIENTNTGSVYVTGSNSIGMYGTGSGTLVENRGNIYLDASGSSSTNKKSQMIGMFLDNGAKGVNYNNIKTLFDYSTDSNVSNIIGVVVKNGSTFENRGNIEIKSKEGIGIFVDNGIIKNYGHIIVSGNNAAGVKYQNNSKTPSGEALDPTNINDPLLGTVSAGGNEYVEVINDPTSTVGSVENKPDPVTGLLTPKVAGQVVPYEYINYIPELGISNNVYLSRVGLYVDTLGRTRPIETDDSNYVNTGVNALIIGTEAADITNSKSIKIGSNILGPFLSTILGTSDPQISSGSLTWNATANDTFTDAIMTKLPYTDFAPDKNTTKDIYNFSEGLEQRYDKNAIGSKEKMLFNKLNGIGKNEDSLLTQSFDQMMGHQYANTKTRMYNSSSALNRGFEDLLGWGVQSKDSNKIKLIGGVSESQTDTAGIVDYDNNNTGVVYVREDESMNLGKSQGWYAGLLYDRYKFKDIGKSTEDGVTTKVGLYKSIPFDLNNSLNWTIKGDVEAGTRNMHRKYLVVDTIFNAQSTYYTYGASLSNELSKSIRLSKGWTLKPYGALDLGYGAYTDIKENKGEMRLELKSSNYNSIKPSAGAELSYKAPITRYATFGFALGGKYEHELGKIAESKNQVKVKGTTADYYNLRTEKAEKGNGSFDVNISIENSKVGFTLGGTYKTSGEFTGNTGIRWIF